MTSGRVIALVLGIMMMGAGALALLLAAFDNQLPEDEPDTSVYATDCQAKFKNNPNVEECLATVTPQEAIGMQTTQLGVGILGGSVFVGGCVFVGSSIAGGSRSQPAAVRPAAYPAGLAPPPPRP